MELNFIYIHDGKRGKITLNAEELDYIINYSQLNRYRPTASNPSSYGWLPIQNGGLRQTVPRFYGTVQHMATYNVLPASLVSEIRKFDGNNTYALDRVANFIEKDALNNYTGIDLYVQGDDGEKKVCKFQWAVLEEDDPEHPGQKILSSYFNGLYNFACPEDDFPNSSVGTLSNLNGVAGKYSADAKIALWIITVHDDISGSPTYGQDFKVLVESHSQPTGFPSMGVIMADMRCLKGVENSSNIINGSDPKKNSTTTGWGGKRNVWSSSDTITQIPEAFNESVNFGDHGIFIYRMYKQDLEGLSGYLWADSTYKKFKDTIYSPSSGILSIHKVPYLTEFYGGNIIRETIVICGELVGTGLSQRLVWVDGDDIPKVVNESYTAMGTRIKRGQQFQSVKSEIDPGFYVEPFFNSFLDFEPYTQISIRLPFIGTVAIPTNTCMGGYIRVNYLCDNANGNVVAQIYTRAMRNTEDTSSDGWQIIGQYSGNCALPMALTGNSMGSSGQMGAITGFASNAAGSILMGAAGTVAPGVAAAGVAASAIAAGIQYATAPKETRVIGSLSANTACLTDLSCRVMITRPWDVVPGEWKTTSGERVFSSDELLNQAGLESFSGGKVGTYEGMTKGLIRGSIEGATEVEMNEIRAAFAGGVIV